MWTLLDYCLACYLNSIAHLFPRNPAPASPDHLCPTAASHHELSMSLPPLLERMLWIIEISEPRAEVCH
jgi:hypothetical protein